MPVTCRGRSPHFPSFRAPPAALGWRRGIWLKDVRRPLQGASGALV